MKKEYSEKEALSRAASLCSAGEQCVSQIEEKLQRWGVDPEAQQRIINQLVEEKYIDEQRFANAYAKDKLRYNHWGRVKIALYLRQLGIASSLIRQALDKLPNDEYFKILTHLIVSKTTSVKASSDYEQRGKLIRFALGRGFEMDEILEALRL